MCLCICVSAFKSDVAWLEHSTNPTAVHEIVAEIGQVYLTCASLKLYLIKHPFIPLYNMNFNRTLIHLEFAKFDQHLNSSYNIIFIFQFALLIEILSISHKPKILLKT